jgi:RNA polymerase sigma-70 factor, ECF subfamily
MGFLWSVSPRSDVAEDLFQQTVLTMWQKADEFALGTNFAAWACSIAKLKAREYSRARRRLLFDSDIISQLADEQGAEDMELRLMRRRALVGCLGKLRPEDRDLVETCYQGDQLIRQVADDFGRSVRSVYKALARIRKALYRCVEAKIAQEEH